MPASLGARVLLRVLCRPHPARPAPPPQLKGHSCLATSQRSLSLTGKGTALWLMNLALCCGPGRTDGIAAGRHPAWPMIVPQESHTE